MAGRNWLTIYNLSFTKVNTLYGASYQVFRHTEMNETVIRTISYSLPAALHEQPHVQTVAPTVRHGPSGECRNWCLTPRLFPMVTSSCKKCRQHLLPVILSFQLLVPWLHNNADMPKNVVLYADVLATSHVDEQARH
jgi:hypothetical protein